METGALAPYEAALRSAGQLALHTADGRRLVLDVARWLGPADAADLTVVRRCEGPVLDVGCGPGRFVSSLHARGIFTLGVDIAETAVELTRGLGMPALLGSVFGALPGEGRWATVLLLDGNVGIGGDPVRLLNRVGSLLAPDGRLIVETAPQSGRGAAAEPVVQTVRFAEAGVPVGPEFDWAVVDEASLLDYAARTGYRPLESWSSDGRTFVVLGR